MSPAAETKAILDQLGLDCSDGDLVSFSPIDGREIGRVATADVGNAAGQATR